MSVFTPREQLVAAHMNCLRHIRIIRCDVEAGRLDANEGHHQQVRLLNAAIVWRRAIVFADYGRRRLGRAA